jgi:large subunit ribosomal protein L2
MALKTFKPVTPSLRQLVIVDRSDLYKGKPVKTLTEGKTSSGGRNNNGRVTVRFRGGGHKQAYRLVDFKRRKLDVVAKVERIEYDPNRTAFIALIRYADDELAYILAPQRLSPGDEVIAGAQVDVKPGNAMPIGNIPVGTIVHNVEIKIGKGGAIARSAGNYAQIVGRDQGYVIIRLNSGEQRLVHGQCFATIGAVSNPDHMNISLGKAGRNRWLGRRPHNRGVTMNPVDHPHGGGEGKTKGGRHPVTPWGVPTLGKRTRRKHKESDKLIVRGRRRGKERKR